jgi:tetratricopeptide (TPR) repeat protein
VRELVLPQSVKEAIGRRLTRLAEPTVDALRIAAALGKVFSFRDLAAVSTAGEDALLDALDEASGAQLVRAGVPGSAATRPGGDAFTFTHDKIREVLYEELNPIRRRRLHQRIGETLERLYQVGADAPPTANAAGDPHVQDLAHHFLQAGDLERSLVYLRRAAEDAERVFAHDEALRFLEQARDSAQALGRADALAAIDEAIGDTHEARGVVRPAVESYERALAAATSREARAALKAKIGNAYVPIGDPRGLAYLEESLVELDPHTQANALALATALVGRYYHYRTEHTRAIEFFDRARALAEPIGDPATLVQIYSFLCGANQHLVRFAEGDRWARKCIAMGERERYPEAIATGYEFLAENAFNRGRWDEALAYAAQDREQGSRCGSLARVAWSEFCRVNALYGKGELRMARDAAQAALASSEQIGETRLATWLEPCVALAAADLGEDDAALRHAEGGLARAEQLQQLVLSAWAMHALGHVALQRDDPGAALGWFERFVALLAATENRVAHNYMLARAAEAFLECGRLDEADRLAAQTLAVGELADSQHTVARARSVQARLLAARAQVADARTAFDDAIATFERLGSRLELARTLRHRAVFLLQCGDAQGAHADARQSVALATTLGAAKDRARAERLLQ